MNASVYSSLFSINLYHTYFAKGLFTRFTLNPVANTKNVMHNISLVCRQVDNTFTVIYDKAAFPPQDGFAMANPLTFAFTAVDTSFTNYTALPLDKMGEMVYYFSDLSATSVNGVKRLTKDEYVGDAERITIKPSCFNFSLGSSKATGDEVITITAFKDNTVIQSLKPGPGNNIQVNLANAAPGRYRINLNKNILLDFYASDELFFTKPTGIFEFFKYDNITNGVTGANEFSLYFNARSTFWKYIIINKKNISLFNNFSIFSSNCASEDDLFDHLENTKLIDKTTAEVFVSKTQIPLAEIPEERFKLTAWQNNNILRQVALFDPLPVANAYAVKAANENNIIKIYSEIYVYI